MHGTAELQLLERKRGLLLCCHAGMFRARRLEAALMLRGALLSTTSIYAMPSHHL
jgi:hypothetical protein